MACGAYDVHGGTPFLLLPITELTPYSVFQSSWLRRVINVFDRIQIVVKGFTLPIIGLNITAGMFVFEIFVGPISEAVV
jgi:hypothetical protein